MSEKFDDIARRARHKWRRTLDKLAEGFDGPEPPPGSVVFDSDGRAWRRVGRWWHNGGDTYDWAGLEKLGPLMLTHWADPDLDSE